MSSTACSLRWLWLSVAVIVLDQLTKQWAEASFRLHQDFAVIDGFFSFTLAYNTGAAFSFLAGAGGWQRWFFSILAAAVSIGLIIWLKKLDREERLEAFGLSLVIGGASGNLIDRLVHGHVIDFLLFYYRQWSWPAFNIADSAIFVGVIALLIGSFRHPSRAR